MASKTLVFNIKLSDFPNMRCYRLSSNTCRSYHEIRELIRKNILSDDGTNFLVSRTVDFPSSHIGYNVDVPMEFYVMADRDSWLSMMTMTLEDIRVDEVAMIHTTHNNFRGKVYI